MKRRDIVRIGGVINACCTVFHALFPVLFAWQQTLACVSPFNRALMYALGNHATLVLAGFTYFSFAYTDELTETRLGRAVCKLIAVFYALRLVEEWTIFSAPVGSAVGISALCIILGVIYGIASRSPSTRITVPLESREGG